MSSNLETYEVLVTVPMKVTIDRSKFSEQFMQEFRESFYDFDQVEEHAEHIAQLVLRGGRGPYPEFFIEGYGPSADMGIEVEEGDSIGTEIVAQSCPGEGGRFMNLNPVQLLQVLALMQKVSGKKIVVSGGPGTAVYTADGSVGLVPAEQIIGGDQLAEGAYVLSENTCSGSCSIGEPKQACIDKGSYVRSQCAKYTALPLSTLEANAGQMVDGILELVDGWG